MVDYQQQIKELEDELAGMQYNKRTQKHYGLVKAKIAKLREADEQRGKQSGPKTGYEVRKSGDGTVILLGFPSVGKSTLLNELTDADSEVGSYAFTTLSVVPGTLEHKHARIQLLDVPGIVSGAASGKGRGKEVLAAMRSADLCLMLIDATRPYEIKTIKKEVAAANIRLNQKPPIVKITKKEKDGVKIGATCPIKKIDDETIETILKEFKIINADVVLREDVTPDQFIDVIEGNKVYMPCMLVFNKCDLVTPKERERLKREYDPDLMISAEKSEGIEDVKTLIYDKLDLINIYMKEPNKDADLEVPLVMNRGSRIRDVCQKLHRDFVKRFRYARVWGDSAKFPGQTLMLKHKLKDGDVLEIHTT